MASDSTSNDWRSEPFRQRMVARIDQAIQHAVVPLSINGDARTVEDHIFNRSNNYESYVSFVGKVLHAAAGPGTGGVANPNQNQPGPQPMQMYQPNHGNPGGPTPVYQQQMGQQHQEQMQMRMPNSSAQQMPPGINMGGIRPNRPGMIPAGGNYPGGPMERTALTKQDVTSVLESLTPEVRHQLNGMSQQEKSNFFLRCKMQQQQNAARMAQQQQQQQYRNVRPQQSYMQSGPPWSPDGVSQSQFGGAKYSPGPNFAGPTGFPSASGGMMMPSQQQQMYGVGMGPQMNMPPQQQQNSGMGGPNQAMMNENPNMGPGPQYRNRPLTLGGPLQAGHMQPTQSGQQVMYGGMVLSGGGGTPQAAQSNPQMSPMVSNPPQQHMAAANFGPPVNSAVAAPNVLNSSSTGHLPGNAQSYQVPSPMVPGPSPGYPQGPSPSGYSVVVSNGQSTSGSRGADVAPSPSGRVSSGPPSVGQTAPLGESAPEDPTYREKVADLQRFYDPLKKMLEEKDQSHQNQKFAGILEILENRRKVTFEVLVKCEDVLKKLFEKPEKHSEGSIFQPLLEALAQCNAHANSREILKRTLELPEFFIPELEIRSPCIAAKKMKLESTAVVSVKTELFEGADGVKQETDDRSLETPPPVLTEESKIQLNGTVTREVAMLEPRFRIRLDVNRISLNKKEIDIVCELGDKDLPCVPSLRLSIPDNYPQSGPKCDRELSDYGEPRRITIFSTHISVHRCSIVNRFSWDSVSGMCQINVDIENGSNGQVRFSHSITGHLGIPIEATS